MNSSLTPGSVTNWLLDNHGHRTGAEVELLWQRFGLRLVRIARQHLQTVSDHSYDEEDLAHSTFNEFFVRALDGQYQNLTSRQELWRLLVTISCNKSRRMRKRANHLHVPKEILPNHGVRMHRERITDEKKRSGLASCDHRAIRIPDATTRPTGSQRSPHQDRTDATRWNEQRADRPATWLHAKNHRRTFGTDSRLLEQPSGIPT